MHTLSDARISPVFRYADAPAAIDWLVRAYGFIRHEIHHTPEGGIAHAELRRHGGRRAQFGRPSRRAQSLVFGAPRSLRVYR